MDQIKLTSLTTNERTLLEKSSATNNEYSKPSNAVLRRLIEEVKYESQNNISAYNRTHNRHNRGR
jgi:hypothetical protein